MLLLHKHIMMLKDNGREEYDSLTLLPSTPNTIISNKMCQFPQKAFRLYNSNYSSVALSAASSMVVGILIRFC